MDKNAIKKFAVWARRELIERVSQKAMQYGIEKDNIVDAAADSVGGKVLTDIQKNQRRALISQINAKGYEEVMEEVAYTWFNRLIALRFMEVNGYLPTRVRVFTDEENNFKPQIIDEALHLDLDGLNMDKVYEFKNANQTEELYKYLLITQCNALNSVLPGMFQRISDYTELLLPDNLLREGSVIEQMISTIPEEDWQDAVQIIGWLYQFYNIEPKAAVFAKSGKISKNEIPAATQLFTPDWIVRYMVENSLGRLWVEGHPNDKLKSGWKYYLEETEQEPEVQVQLTEIRKEYATMTPEQIKCIDPCCGSGHILAYLFDVLVQIYENYGYTTREAVESIVKNNLYGLDIDDRAAQLAYFAVMMKARQHDRRFFSRQIQPNVYAIQESNDIDRYALEYFCNGDSKLKAAMDSIITEMHDAKEYGSILNITPVDFAALYARFDEVRDDISMSKESVLNNLLPLVQVAEALAQKYDVVCTNPPYMGSGNMGDTLSEFVKNLYPDTKVDLSTVFMEKNLSMCNALGFVSMINIPVWMNLAGCQKFRIDLIENRTLVNMLHFGRGIFGSDFGSTAFIFTRKYIPEFKGKYRRLFLQQGAVDSIEQKEQWFFDGIGEYVVKQSNFKQIPGSAFAYQVSERIYNHFALDKTLGKYGTAKQGLITGNNDAFMRFWFEISSINMQIDCPNREYTLSNGIRWYPYNKGGEYRKWFGNCWYVVDWSNDGFQIQHYYDDKGKLRSRPQNMAFYFREGLTWTALTAGKFSMRYSPNGFLFDAMGPVYFPDEKDNLNYIFGLLNSKLGVLFLRILCPNLKFDQKPLESVPLIIDESERGNVDSLVKNCIICGKQDWDSFETSWDFTKHPLICPVSTLTDAFAQWETECDDRFAQLKANEEELNRIFIDIYGLQEELTPEVEDKDVTVRKADLQRDIKSLISYAVGCMFGRYSPLKDGLLYAGGDWDYTAIQQELMDAIGKNEFSSGDMVWDANFIDKDNIIPICDDEYFDDDIVGRFVKFIEAVYGKDTLEENLKFIADALGGKGQPREVIRNYFLNDFYADHCKIYQKRPIYWLFDSGKKNGFKALIYMHRYQPDTIARIRTDYVHEQQSRYRTAIADMENRIANASTSERVKLNKALTKLKDQDGELRNYEEKIHHLADQMIVIDLDDGVKVNYAKFQDVLAKIK